MNTGKEIHANSYQRQQIAEKNAGCFFLLTSTLKREDKNDKTTERAGNNCTVETIPTPHCC